MFVCLYSGLKNNTANSFFSYQCLIILVSPADLSSGLPEGKYSQFCILTFVEAALQFESLFDSSGKLTLDREEATAILFQ